MLTLAALCGVGAEKVVSQELRKMGLQVLESAYGRVRFSAGIEGIYRALLGLRAADRVLLEAGRFPARDFEALFEGVRRIPWEDYIPRGMGLLVDKVRTNRSHLQAETSVQGVVHKAAAERLCGKFRIRRLPEEGSRATLRVYLEKNEASILLDLSGDPLFKRGYRSGAGGIAPLRETTAAAILLLSGWKRKFPLYDPFCGSGTILWEAILYAYDIPPGLDRRFALEKLLLSDRRVEGQVREELLDRIDRTRRVRIRGSDADPRALALAQTNGGKVLGLLGKASPGLSFRLEALPAEEAAPEEEEGGGFLITNPPWGMRLGDEAASEGIYTRLGETARRFGGWKLALLTSHAGFESLFGRKADSCREISSGAVKGYLYQYEKL